MSKKINIKKYAPVFLAVLTFAIGLGALIVSCRDLSNLYGAKNAIFTTTARLIIYTLLFALASFALLKNYKKLFIALVISAFAFNTLEFLTRATGLLGYLQESEMIIYPNFEKNIDIINFVSSLCLTFSFIFFLAINFTSVKNKTIKICYYITYVISIILSFVSFILYFYPDKNISVMPYTYWVNAFLILVSTTILSLTLNISEE